jgi:hypothetical protein
VDFTDDSIKELPQSETSEVMPEGERGNDA